MLCSLRAEEHRSVDVERVELCHLFGGEVGPLKRGNVLFLLPAHT